MQLFSFKEPVFAVFVVVSFALFADAVGFGGWDRHWEQALFLIAGCVGVALVHPRARPASKAALVAVAVIGTLLVGLRTWQMADAVRDDRQPTVDIGQTTIAAVDVYAERRNPYTQEIDYLGRQVDPVGTGFRFFGGYKYGPVMVWSFTPMVRAWDAAGLFVMNWLALVASAFATALWTRSGATKVGAVAAFAMVLAPRWMNVELYESGVTDLVPVALGLAAFAMAERRHDEIAGLFIGFSIAAKLLPGVMFAIPLLVRAEHRARMAFAAFLTAFIPHTPFLLNAPREVVANLVNFNLARPFGDTSPLRDLTPWIAGLVAVACAVIAVALLVYLPRAQPRGVRPVAVATSLALAVFLLGGKALNRNYLLWVLPVAAVAVATTVWPREEAEVTDR